MKTTGVCRKVDQLGRVVLPVELRKQFGIRDGDLVEISVDEDRIVLEKVESRCVFCSATRPNVTLIEFRNRLVCEGCLAEITAP